jgi:hypothetical protein
VPDVISQQWWGVVDLGKGRNQGPSTSAAPSATYERLRETISERMRMGYVVPTRQFSTRS